MHESHSKTTNGVNGTSHKVEDGDADHDDDDDEDEDQIDGAVAAGGMFTSARNLYALQMD